MSITRVWTFWESSGGASGPRRNYRALPLFVITSATAKAKNFVVENNLPRDGGWSVAATAISTRAPSGRSQKNTILNSNVF